MTLMAGQAAGNFPPPPPPPPPPPSLLKEQSSDISAGSFIFMKSLITVINFALKILGYPPINQSINQNEHNSLINQNIKLQFMFKTLDQK